MSNNTQLAVQEVRSLVESEGYRKRFTDMLGKRAPAFIASISNIVSQSEELAKCDSRSIILSAVMAATLDLPIEKSLGFAYVVPYGTMATFQLGYKGLIQLALRSGQYAGMRDAFVNREAFKGYDDIGEPIIDWQALDETEEPIGFAFAWRTINGFRKTVYWSKEKCLKHGRKYSRGFGNSKSGWQTNTDAMCMKTVIRAALSKYGILSVELQNAIVSEDVELTTDAEGTLLPKGPSLDALPESTEPPAPEQTMSQKLSEGTKRGPGRPPKNVTPPPAEPPPAQKEEPPLSDPGLADPEPAAETSAPVDREALISELQEACLDNRVSESRLFEYAKKIPGLVHEGCGEVWELKTEALLKLKPAIHAIAKPAGKG